MNVFVKKLIVRLENELADFYIRDSLRMHYYQKGIVEAIEIVNELAEEYKGGWIPCSEVLPEIGTCVLITTESGYVCEDVLIYDYIHSNAKEPCFHRWDDEMWECYTPRVIAWQPLPPAYKPKE